MNIVFVDYSERYYSEGAGTPMPEKRRGKFLQVRNSDTEFLIFSPTELTPFHSDIMERFCRERGIEGASQGRHKRFTIHDPSWVIVGGGKFEFDKVRKYLRLYDDSMVYGAFDRKGFKEKILRVVQLADTEVNIE